MQTIMSGSATASSSMSPLKTLTAALSLTLMVSAHPASAGEVTLRDAESVFAVVTHKAGLAAGMAHNHLIAAADHQAALSFDPAKPLETSFELRAEAAKLEVDRGDLQQTWYPRLEALGVLDEPFGEVSEKDRAKIHDSMVSKGQLNAENFPQITATLLSVSEKATTQGDVAFPYEAKLRLEVRGKAVEKLVAARFEFSGETLNVEAVGAYQFSDFGIKPYSAFFGAVKNQDEIHVYLNLTGTLAEQAAAAAPAED
ncbi:MAG: YceI family protein [Acidobacteriota bacterium]